MSNLVFSMVLKMVDEVSSTANKVASGVERMSNRVARASNKMAGGMKAAWGLSFDALENDVLNKRIGRWEQKVQRARNGLMTSLAAGAAVIAPVVRIGKFEHEMARFGTIASYSKEQLAEIETILRAAGPRVNKYASELLVGLEFLLGKGIDENSALKIIEPVGKASVATGAAIQDMSAAGYAAISNLDIAYSQMSKTFDMMAMSGKLGGFELKDMAKHFPGLTAAAKNLGMVGEPAVARLGAALQIALRGAANPDEAANNLKNFLAKMASPEVVNKFKKMGIDIRAELEVAAKNGIDPMEYMLVRVHDLAEENRYVIQDVFGDLQVQNFLKPMVANLEEYANIRDKTLSADGVIDTDFATMDDTLFEKFKGFQIALDNSLKAGQGLTLVMKDLVVSATKLVVVFNSFSAQNPELVSGFVKATAALLALGAVAGVVNFIWATLGSGLAKFLKLLWRARGVLTFLRIAFLAISASASAMGAALATVTAPVWGLIAAIVAAAAALAFGLWKYWDRISAFTKGFLAPFRKMAHEAWTAVANSVGKIMAKLSELTGIDFGQLGEKIRSFFDFSDELATAKSALDNFWASIMGFFSRELLSDSQKSELSNMGESFAQSLIDGFMAGLVALKDLTISYFAEITSSILPIDLVNLFNWGEPPEWFSWLTGGNKSALASNASGTKTPEYKPVRAPASSAASELGVNLSKLSAQLGGTASKQDVDQSRTVHQSNSYNINVYGGPSAAGNATLGSIRSANDRALRDTD